MPRARSSPWHMPFREQIIKQIIGPEIALILQDGVRSKKHLAEVFSEKFDCKIGTAILDEFLDTLGLQELFSQPKLIRVAPPPATSYQPLIDAALTGSLAEDLQFDNEVGARVGPPPDEAPPLAENRRPRTSI